MRKLFLAAASVLFALSVMACSSSTGGNGNDGGGTREFDSENLNNGESFSHVFLTAKTIPYYCDYHGGPGGSGMSGTVTVSVPGMGYTPITIPVSITSNFLPDLAVNEGDTVVWSNNSGIAHTVESDN